MIQNCGIFFQSCSKMKILQITQTSFSSLNVNLSQLNQKNPFNEKNVSIIFILGMVTISCGAYFFNLANKFQEYAYSVYVTSTMLCVTMAFTVAIARISILSEYIDNLQTTLNQSKVSICFNSFCQRTNDMNRNWMYFRTCVSRIDSNVRGNGFKSWKFL